MQTEIKTIKDFKNTCAYVEIPVLENIGWDFYRDYKEIAEAQNISMDEAKEYLHSHYFAVIEVDENLKTFTWEEHKRLNEFSDKEETGDNVQTFNDLIDLYKADQILKFEKL